MYGLDNAWINNKERKREETKYETFAKKPQNNFHFFDGAVAWWGGQMGSKLNAPHLRPSIK